MKIVVQKEGRRILRLRIPLGLLMNRAAASAAAGALARRGINITREQLFAMMKAIKEVRRRHPDWVLVEMEGGSGETLKVEL